MTKVSALPVGTVFTYEYNQPERFAVITPRGLLNTYSLDNHSFVQFGVETDVTVTGELIDAYKEQEEIVSQLRKEIWELKQQLRAEQRKRAIAVEELQAAANSLAEAQERIERA